MDKIKLKLEQSFVDKILSLKKYAKKDDNDELMLIIDKEIYESKKLYICYGFVTMVYCDVGGLITLNHYNKIEYDRDNKYETLSTLYKYFMDDDIVKQLEAKKMGLM